MPVLETYLFFDGTCAEAMRFYERTLGGKLEKVMTVGESPVGSRPPVAADKILHARLLIDGHALMASDWMTDSPFETKKGFSLSLVYTSVNDAQRVFDALADGGRITMPFQKTFWVEIFGMVTDRFGTPWMISGGQATA